MTAQQCTPLGFVAVTVPATGSGVGLRLSRIVGSILATVVLAMRAEPPHYPPSPDRRW
jgi:hypothetical protein